MCRRNPNEGPTAVTERPGIPGLMSSPTLQGYGVPHPYCFAFLPFLPVAPFFEPFLLPFFETFSFFPFFPFFPFLSFLYFLGSGESSSLMLLRSRVVSSRFGSA